MGSWWRWWAFAAYKADARSLAFVRIAYATFVLVFAPSCARRFLWVADMPASFFSPPLGPMRMFLGPPSEATLHLLCVGVFVAATAVLLGYRTTISSVALATLLLVGDGFSYSFSKINHSSVASMLPIALALAGWGSCWSVDAVRGRRTPLRAWPLALLALTIGLSMFSAGWPKLDSGWLDTGQQATRFHFLRRFLVVGPTGLMAPILAGVTAPWYWEVMDWTTVGLEIALLPAVFVPRLFRPLLAVTVLFHLGVFLIFNIAFSAQILAYAPFADWSAVLKRISRGKGRRPGWLTSNALAAGGVALGVFAYSVPSGVRHAHVPGWPSVRVANAVWLSAAGILLGVVIVHWLGRLRRHSNRTR